MSLEALLQNHVSRRDLFRFAPAALLALHSFARGEKNQQTTLRFYYGDPFLPFDRPSRSFFRSHVTGPLDIDITFFFSREINLPENLPFPFALHAYKNTLTVPLPYASNAIFIPFIPSSFHVTHHDVFPRIVKTSYTIIPFPQFNPPFSYLTPLVGETHEDYARLHREANISLDLLTISHDGLEYTFHLSLLNVPSYTAFLTEKQDGWIDPWREFVFFAHVKRERDDTLTFNIYVPSFSLWWILGRENVLPHIEGARILSQEYTIRQDYRNFGHGMFTPFREGIPTENETRYDSVLRWRVKPHKRRITFILPNTLSAALNVPLPPFRWEIPVDASCLHAGCMLPWRRQKRLREGRVLLSELTLYFVPSLAPFLLSNPPEKGESHYMQYLLAPDALR